jgi:hypothetical protein
MRAESPSSNPSKQMSGRCGATVTVNASDAQMGRRVGGGGSAARDRAEMLSSEERRNRLLMAVSTTATALVKRSKVPCRASASHLHAL